MANALSFDLLARDRGATSTVAKLGNAFDRTAASGDRLNRSLGSTGAASRGLRSAFQEADRGASGLSGRFALISKLGPRSMSLLATGAKAAGLAIGGAAATGVAFGLKTAASMETARIGFTTMLGSAKKADTFLRQLQKFAAATPFEFPELQTAASSLISVGIRADKVIPIMKTLGNVTAGMGTGSEGIKRATVALQQMTAAQRITAEDLNQLRDAGIPVYDLLAAATGKTKAEVVKLAQAGKLGKKELQQMMDALESGKGLERFNGLMEKQSHSLSGLFSTLKDNVSMTLATLVTPAIPAIEAGLSTMSSLITAVAPKVQAAIGTAIGAIKGFVTAARNGLSGDISSDTGVLRYVALAANRIAAFVTGPLADFARAVKLGLAGEIPATGGPFAYVAKATTAVSDFVTWIKEHGVGDIAAAFTAVKIDLTPIARSFIEQARTWGSAIITGVKTGLDTGDWSGLGETVGKGIVSAINGASRFAKDIATKVGDLLSKVDWVGIGISVGKQVPSLLVGLAAGLLNFDLMGLLKGLAAHWQDVLLAIIAVAFTPARIIGKVAEVLGRIPLAGPLIRWAFEHFASFSKGLVKMVGDALGFMGRAFVDGFRRVFPGVGADFLAHLRNLPVYIRVVALEVKAAAIAMMKGLGDSIAGRIASVVAKIGELIARMLRPFVGAAGWLIRHGIDFVAGLVRGVLSMLGRAASAAGSVISTITRPFAVAGSWLLRRGGEFVGGLVRGIAGMLRSAAEAAGRVVSTVTSRFGGAGGWLVRAGRDLIGGLLSGARAALSAVGGWAKEIGNRIVGAVKNFFGIHSPSTVFAGLGGHLISGLIKGMVDKNPAALVGKVFGGMTNALKTLFTKNLLGSVTSLPAKALSALGGLVGNITGGLSGPVVSGSNVAIGQMLAARYGWTGAQWEALRTLWQNESGWNNNAQNPTSTAYGIAQFLNSTWAAVGATKTSDPVGQISAGLRYIQGSYGSPINALNKWLSRSPHWYDAGGWLPPGLSMSMNGTGRPERIRTGAQEDALLAELRAMRASLAGGRGGGPLIGEFHAHDRADIDLVLAQVEFRARGAAGGF